MKFQDFYKYSGHGQGKKAGAHFGVGKQASRISIFNRNNPLIETKIDKIKIPIHSRALLMVDKSFENILETLKKPNFLIFLSCL